MQLLLAICNVIVVVCYAGLSGLWVDNSSGWYHSLRKPKWQPPNFVFGLIWPYNFFVLGLTGVRISLNSETLDATYWLATLLVSVIFAISWSWDFYKTKNLARAAIWLGACALTTVGLMISVSTFAPEMFWWLLPYQIWLTIAFSLSAGYAYLNPK